MFLLCVVIVRKLHRALLAPHCFAHTKKNPRYCPNIAKMQDGPKEGMKDAKRDIFRHRESNPGLAGAPFFRNGLLSDESGKS
jgi:hypothetical protein